MASNNGKGKNPAGLDDTTLIVLLVLGVPLVSMGFPRVRDRVLDKLGVAADSKWRGDLKDMLVAASPWLIAAVGLYLVWQVLRWLHRRRVQRRAAIRARLADHLAPVLGRSWEQDKLHVGWRRGRLHRVRVPLPSVVSVEDPDWRHEFMKAAQAGAGLVLVAQWPTDQLESRWWRGSVSREVILEPPSHSTTGAEPEGAGGEVRGFLLPLLPSRSEVDAMRDESGQVCEVVVRYGETTRDMSPSWRARLSAQLAQRVGGQWVGEWDTATRVVRLRPVPSLPDVVPWTPPPPRAASGFPVAPYGVDEAGQLKVWEMGDRQPHAVVTGSTGSGKTEAMRAMIAGALRAGAAVVIIDPKFKDFSVFLGYPGVAAVVSSTEDSAALIEAVVAEMHRRNAALALMNVAGGDVNMISPAERERLVQNLMSLVVVIDENTQLIDNLNAWWAGLSKEARLARAGTASTKCPYIGMIGQIAQLARASRIHLLLGMQRADVKNFGDSTQMRDQLPHRVSMGSLSGIGSEQTWGDRQVGQIFVEQIGEGVSNGAVLSEPGRVVHRGQPVRFRSSYITDEQLRAPEFRTAVEDAAPDLSGLDLGAVSASATNVVDAVSALRKRAGLSSTNQGHTTVAHSTAAAGGGEIIELPTQAANPAGTTTDVVAVDYEGGVWEQVAVTELEEGDVLDSDAGRMRVSAPPAWVEDETTGDELLRLEIESPDGEETWDYSGDDLVTKLAVKA